MSDADVFGVLRGLVRTLRALKRNRPPGSPLAPRHLMLLVELLALDRPITVSELAGRLDVTLGTASVLVGELAECGLVTRTEDAADHRRTLVAVVPGPYGGASREVTDVVASWIAPVHAALARLDPTLRARAAETFAALADEMESHL